LVEKKGTLLHCSLVLGTNFQVFRKIEVLNIGWCTHWY
jgi:hypothetical protein